MEFWKGRYPSVTIGMRLLLQKNDVVDVFGNKPVGLEDIHWLCITNASNFKTIQEQWIVQFQMYLQIIQKFPQISLLLTTINIQMLIFYSFIVVLSFFNHIVTSSLYSRLQDLKI